MSTEYQPEQGKLNERLLTVHPHPAMYGALEGPGSTGKSSIIRDLPSILADLLGHSITTLPYHTFAEPFTPSNWPPGVPPPYQLTKRQLAGNNPFTYAIYLTATRRMIWGCSTFDGELLDPLFYDTLRNPKGILIGDRSPLSMIYQGVYPGSNVQFDASTIFPTLYGDNLIPFPDCLFVLMPDPEAQKQRLIARIEADGGELTDFGDAVDFQTKIIQGYEATLRIIRSWPGVYRLESQQVKYKLSIGITTAIALVIFANMIEKGLYEPEHTLVYTLESPYTGMRAYVYRNIVGRSINEGSKYFILNPNDRARWNQHKIIVKNYGDLALLIRGFNLYVIIIEDPTKTTLQDAIKTALDGSYTLLKSDNIICPDLYPRAWRNITW